MLSLIGIYEILSYFCSNFKYTIFGIEVQSSLYLLIFFCITQQLPNYARNITAYIFYVMFYNMYLF